MEIIDVATLQLGLEISSDRPHAQRRSINIQALDMTVLSHYKSL